MTDATYPLGLPQVARICKNYTAYVAMNDTRNGLYYECGGSPEKLFKKYDRHRDDSDFCDYNVTYHNGTSVTIRETPKCGYNADTYPYCPKRRGYSDYSGYNEIMTKLWEENQPLCHHRSTIQYCRNIEDNHALSVGYREFMRYEVETTGDLYPLIANNKRCVGDVVLFTKGYWRIIDSALTTTLTYFALVAALFSVTYLY